MTFLSTRQKLILSTAACTLMLVVGLSPARSKIVFAQETAHDCAAAVANQTIRLDLDPFHRHWAESKNADYAKKGCRRWVVDVYVPAIPQRSVSINGVVNVLPGATFRISAPAVVRGDLKRTDCDAYFEEVLIYNKSRVVGGGIKKGYWENGSCSFRQEPGWVEAGFQTTEEALGPNYQRDPLGALVTAFVEGRLGANFRYPAPVAWSLDPTALAIDRAIYRAFRGVRIGTKWKPVSVLAIVDRPDDQ